jgi:hypothetical protein
VTVRVKLMPQSKKILTLDDLKQMTPEKRAQLYENARKLRGNGGQEIIDLLDSSGLPLSSGAMRVSDPDFLKMEEIVWSSEGRKAAIEATDKGLPALAGVEPLIVEGLGNRYHSHDQGTMNAGSLVATVMRHSGYVEAGQSNMPIGSIAKSALKWIRRKD